MSSSNSSASDEPNVFLNRLRNDEGVSARHLVGFESNFTVTISVTHTQIKGKKCNVTMLHVTNDPTSRFTPAVDGRI